LKISKKLRVKLKIRLTSTKSKVTQPEMCMYKQSVSENISEIYTTGIKTTLKAPAHKCLFLEHPVQ